MIFLRLGRLHADGRDVSFGSLDLARRGLAREDHSLEEVPAEPAILVQERHGCGPSRLGSGVVAEAAWELLDDDVPLLDGREGEIQKDRHREKKRERKGGRERAVSGFMIRTYCR